MKHLDVSKAIASAPSDVRQVCVNKLLNYSLSVCMCECVIVCFCMYVGRLIGRQ